MKLTYKSVKEKISDEMLSPLTSVKINVYSNVQSSMTNDVEAIVYRNLQDHVRTRLAHRILIHSGVNRALDNKPLEEILENIRNNYA